MSASSGLSSARSSRGRVCGDRTAHARRTEFAGHPLEAGDPLGHRRVGREQRGQALTAERVGDHQVALGDQPVVLRQRQRGGPALDLAQRRAPARAGRATSSAPGGVGLVLAAAADRHLHQPGGDRAEHDQQQAAERVAAARGRRTGRRTATRTSPCAPGR